MTHYMDASQSKKKTVYPLKASLNNAGMKLMATLISNMPIEGLVGRIRTDRILKK